MTAQTRPDIAARASPEFQTELVALIPHLRAFSRMLCGKRGIADDMTQAALTNAWRARDRFEPGTNLKAWLFTILRNEFYSQMRRGWRETLWDSEKAERIAAPADQQHWAAELSDTARAMHSLPHDQREALILIGAGGMTYEEAALVCGTRIGTMKSRVARARVALRAILESAEPMPVRPAAALTGACDEVLVQLRGFTRLGANGTAVRA